MKNFSMYRNRLQELYRTTRYLRQALGWQKAWHLVHATEHIPTIAPFPTTDRPLHILVLAPHPDDEAFGCGGALSYHAQRSDQIHILYLHSGDGGNPEQSGDSSLANQREQEAAATAKLLGAAATFWRVADGQRVTTARYQHLLAQLVEATTPDRIYVPWPSDNHPDHMDTTELTRAALRKTTQAEIWQYEIWSPLVPNYFLPIGSVKNEKLHLMNTHVSQVHHRSYREGILGLNTYRGLQANLDEPAEAYWVQSVEHFIAS